VELTGKARISVTVIVGLIIADVLPVDSEQ